MAESTDRPVKLPVTARGCLVDDEDGVVFCHAHSEVAAAEIAAALNRDHYAAVMRAALETIAEEHDAGRHDGHPEPCPAHEAVVMWLTARDALALIDAGPPTSVMNLRAAEIRPPLTVEEYAREWAPFAAARLIDADDRVLAEVMLPEVARMLAAAVNARCGR